MSNNDIHKTYFSKRSLIIAVVLTVAIGLGSIGWYIQTSSADLTQAEIETYISLYISNTDNQEWIKEQLGLATLRQSFIDYGLANNDILKAHEKSANTNFTSIAKVLDNHNTQLIVLRAQAQITIPDVSQGTGDFDLKTINLQTFQVTTEFPQNMPVYITGNYDGPSSKIDYDIYKNGILYATGNPSITAGTFTFAFNVNGNAELGEYSVTVLIDNKKDTISFTIE